MSGTLRATPHVSWHEISPRRQKDLKGIGWDQASWDHGSSDRAVTRDGVGAASAADAVAPGLVVGAALFWLMGSVANNITTKGAMAVFPFPLSVAFVGLLWQVGAGFVQRMFSNSTAPSTSNGATRTPSLLVMVLISVGLLGNFVFHRVALKNSSVPFTHTAKSSSTVFVALLSLVWLKESLDRNAWGCIGLLISGIAIATCTEIEFSKVGCMAALLSAAAQSLQVVGTKVLLRQGHEKTLVYYKSNLYAVGIFFPIWAYVEASAVVATVSGMSTIEGMQVVGPVVLSGFCLYWQEASGFWCLTLVGPVSHAMGNGIRSLVVIAVGAWYFNTPSHSEGAMRLLNALGVTLAVVAIMLYSWLSSRKPAPKVA